MGKSLSEMSLEELWQLFPIILKEHNTDYKVWYLTEKYEHNRDGYTEAKTNFIMKYTEIAKKDFNNKYLP